MNASTSKKRSLESDISNSDSDSEDKSSSDVKRSNLLVSDYELRPVNPFFEEQRLAMHFGQLRSLYGAATLFADSVQSLNSLSTCFSVEPTTRQYFVQYTYKEMPHVVVVTNAYGLVVDKSGEYGKWPTETPISKIEPTDQVKLFLPTTDNWWHEPSKALMVAFVQRIINDMKALCNVDSFKQAVYELNINAIERIAKLRRKIFTGQRAPTPGVFIVRICNLLDHLLTPHIQVVKPNGKLKEGVWNALVRPTFIHAVMLLRCRGIKLLQENITIDFELVNMTYCKINRTLQLSDFDSLDTPDRLRWRLANEARSKKKRTDWPVVVLE